MPTIRNALFVLLIVLACALPAPVFAKGVINTSCSSQISEIFRGQVLSEFTKATGIKANVHIFSSQVSIYRVKNGISEMATTALKLSAADKKSGLVEIPLCKDPMVVIAGNEINVTNLSLAEVRQLFSGFITNWKEVGGPDLPVRIVTPVRETAAYVNFTDQAMGTSQIKFDYQAAKSSGAVEAVNHIPGTISFATRSVVNQYDDIHTFIIDGMSPSDPEYPYTQTFSLVTRGEPSGMIREVINYALSAKSRENMTGRGLTPLIN